MFCRYCGEQLKTVADVLVSGANNACLKCFDKQTLQHIKKEMPRFEHDCDRCVFLGQHKECDLYFCEQGGFDPTIIARWGKHGDYYSGMAFRDHNPFLREAFKRACERGLINRDDYPTMVRCKCGNIHEEGKECPMCPLSMKLMRAYRAQKKEETNG